MSCSENEGDTLVLSKEQVESSSTDEGSCSGSSAGGGVTLKKGPWTTAEDALLISYVRKHGEGNWNAVQRHSGLLRCGKSCRLRWANHLRPHLKKGAFSPEEEQLIIQMHSKMGNRWARMAALLPGRTDNEIKNYWNTRIKRRSRAGLPLYPPNFSFQTSTDDLPIQSSSELINADQQNIEVLTETMNGTPGFRCRPYKPNPVPLSYQPLLPDNAVTGMPSHGLGYYTRSFLNSGGNHVKLACESETCSPVYHLLHSSMFPAFSRMNTETNHLNTGLVYPYDPDPQSKSLAPFICSVPGNPALSNGNLSTSRLLPGAVKMELPSLQYPEPDYIDWNTSSSFTALSDAVHTYIQSPENISVQSDCASLRNKGLLQDLVQESQAISSGKKQSSETSFDHPIAAITGTTAVKWEEEIGDPTSPFCLSAFSLFNECNPTITTAFNERSTCETLVGSEATILDDKQDKYAPSSPDVLRPDVLLGSGFFIGNSRNSSVAAPLGKNLRVECALLPAGMSSMASLGSHPWNNMPPVSQISEH